MQEEITRLVQGLDDSALRFIEACVRHERETPVHAASRRPIHRPGKCQAPDLGTARRRLQGVS